VLWLRGKPHGEQPGPCEVQRSEVRACKTGARSWPKNGRHSHPTAPKQKRAVPSAEQTDLGEGWNHVVRGGRVVKATTPLPTPNHPSHPVTEAHEQPKVTATRNTTRPQKSVPKTSAASKPDTGKSKKAAAASVKTAAAKPTTPNLVVHNQSTTYPLEEISGLDHLPLDECVQVTRQLLTSISSCPTGAAHPRAVLKTVMLFVTEYGSTP
jgi:hypothetical protein